MEEIFGAENFVSIIPFRKKTMPLGSSTIDQMYDFLIWYCKSKKSIKYHTLYQELNPKGDFHWKSYETTKGDTVSLSADNFGDLNKLPDGADLIRTVSIKAPGYSEKTHIL